MKHQINKQYGQSRARVQISFENDNGKTRQEFKNECDIQVILRGYDQTGFIAHQARTQPEYGVADSVTYHEALNTVIAANDLFNQMPSKLRTQFNNNPAEFLDFVQNPENKEKMQEMGLLKTDYTSGKEALKKQKEPVITAATASGAKDAQAEKGSIADEKAVT